MKIILCISFIPLLFSVVRCQQPKLTRPLIDDDPKTFDIRGTMSPENFEQRIRDQYNNVCARSVVDRRTSAVQELEAQLKRAIWDANYCETREDCVSYHGYLGRCCALSDRPHINRGADTSTIDRLDAELDELVSRIESEVPVACHDLGYLPACYENKCI